MWNRFLLVRAGARAVGVACNRCMQRVLDVYRPSAGSRRILRKFSDGTPVSWQSSERARGEQAYIHLPVESASPRLRCGVRGQSLRAAGSTREDVRAYPCYFHQRYIKVAGITAPRARRQVLLGAAPSCHVGEKLELCVPSV